jgi:hypothetical protein
MFDNVHEVSKHYEASKQYESSEQNSILATLFLVED